jgi:uncharacterized protein (DUF2252 family)
MAVETRELRPTGSTQSTKRVQLSPDERTASGRAARAVTPRTSHADLNLISERDPVALLAEQDLGRLPELVPIRYGRMLVSPFTFFRGAAGIMAYDLAAAQRTDLNVQLCGDAHLSNFGGFASPERSFVFDLNDFDETLPGPFEWDVKRLAASFEIAGRSRGFGAAERRNVVLDVVRAYREAMRGFASQTSLAVWYSRLDADEMRAEMSKQRDTRQAKAMGHAAAKARSKDSLKAFKRLTHVVDGERRIASDPPIVTPIRELIDESRARTAFEEEIQGLIDDYRQTLQPDRQQLLQSYRFVDIARKVVGVGSVGTRCWIVLMLGHDESDPLFLQVKEAGPSVLEGPLDGSSYENEGQRIVEGQRLMQASSDIFLGWIRNERGLDGVSRDFYLRQLWDWKSSVNLDVIRPRGLHLYAQACGWTLARAHARSGDRLAIAAYLGKADVFDRAIADFATAYADLNERDFAAISAAADAGTVAVEAGL